MRQLRTILIGLILSFLLVSFAAPAGYAAFNPAGSATPALQPGNPPASPAEAQTPVPGGPAREAAPLESLQPPATGTPALPDTGTGSDTDLKYDSKLGSTIYRTLVSLIFICILAFVILRLIYQGRKNIGAPSVLSHKAINVLERQMLQPQKNLCLVEVAGKYLLLGVSEQQINLLAEIEPGRMEEFKQELQAAVATPRSWPPTFQGLWKNFKPKPKS